MTATAALGLGLMMTAPAASAASPEPQPTGFVRLVVPATESAIQLLIDVEAPGLTEGNTVVTVDGTNVVVQRTALGATSVVELTGQQVTVEVGVTRASAADIAITLSDASGTTLFSEQHRTKLADYRDVASPSPSPSPSISPNSTPAPTATSGAPASDDSSTDASSSTTGAKTGLLSSTGVDLGVLLPVALLAVLLGTVALIARKKVRS